MGQANSPDHYLGMVSLSGKPHALFFHGYDSFADWQKTVGSDMSNSELSQKVDNDFQADGSQCFAEEPKNSFAYSNSAGL